MGASSSQPTPPVAEPKKEAATEEEDRFQQSAFSVTPPPLTAVASKEEALENPGEVEELGRKAKECLPETFDGYRLILTKPLSNVFQTTHTVALGSQDGSSYQFGALYAGTKKVAENEYHPIMVGDIATNGNFNLVWAHQFTDTIRSKVIAHVRNSQWSGIQAQTSYLGEDFTATSLLVNPDISDMSFIAVQQYFQSITPRLSLGAEFLLQRAQGIEGGVLSLVGRYATPKWEATAKLGQHSWDVSYLHKVNDSLTFVSNLEGSPLHGESKLSFGYTFDLPDNNFTFKAAVSSAGSVSAVAEKRLLPLPGSLVLSGQLDHVKNESKFGIGVSVG